MATQHLAPDTTVVLSGGFVNGIKSIFARGEKLFELANHLGSVLVTISDKKIGVDANSDGIIDYYNADVVSAQDFYPFGFKMPGRQWSNGSYRYGFNGKEEDDEVSGDGNQYDYGMRIYNPRLGRFLSVDPLGFSYPWYTPYQFAGNTPIQAIDLDGGEPKGYQEGHPYGASHPGTTVKGVPSKYDNQAWMVGINGGPKQLMHVYAIQDIDKKTYLIFETATGAKSQWYIEYDKEGYKGDVNSFTWSKQPNPANLLTAFIFVPMVALPGAVAVGTTTAGTYILKEIGEEAFEQVTGIPVILDPLDIVKRAVKGAYKDAAKKELKNFFKQNVGESIDEIKKRLTKSIKSHEKEILQHENLIKDPKKYMKEYKKGDWDKLDPRQQKALVEKEWVRHKERHEAMKAAKEQALKDIKQ
jgi:RHS repeat-associated protein